MDEWYADSGIRRKVQEAIERDKLADMTAEERFPDYDDEGEEWHTKKRRRRRKNRAIDKESPGQRKKERDERQQKGETQLHWQHRQRMLRMENPADQLRENIEILLDEVPQMSKTDREQHLHDSQQSWSASPSEIQRLLTRYPDRLDPKFRKHPDVSFSPRQTPLSEDEQNRHEETAQHRSEINHMKREDYRSTWEGSEDQKLGIGPEREPAHPTGAGWSRHPEPENEDDRLMWESPPLISPDEMEDRARATVYAGRMRNSKYLRHYFNEEGFLEEPKKDKEGVWQNEWRDEKGFLHTAGDRRMDSKKEGGIEYSGDPYRRRSPLPEEGAPDNYWRALQYYYPMEYVASAVRLSADPVEGRRIAEWGREHQRDAENKHLWGTKEYSMDDEPEDFLIDTKEIVDARIARKRHRSAALAAHAERFRQERRAKEGEESE